MYIKYIVATEKGGGGTGLFGRWKSWRRIDFRVEITSIYSSNWTFLWKYIYIATISKTVDLKNNLKKTVFLDLFIDTTVSELA